MQSVKHDNLLKERFIRSFRVFCYIEKVFLNFFRSKNVLVMRNEEEIYFFDKLSNVLTKKPQDKFKKSSKRVFPFLVLFVA